MHATTALQRVLARGCWSEVQALRHQARGARRPVRARRAAGLRRAARQPEGRPRRVEPARRAQPDECAGRHRRRRARGRGARSGSRGAGRLPERAAPARAARRVPGGRGKVYDDFAHHPTAMRATVGGLRRLVEGTAPRRSAARTHPGRLRAALQHHEAGHHEGAAALGAGRGRPRLRPAGRLRLARARGAGAAGPRRRGGRLGRRAGGRHREGGAARRPRAVHEQRRFRRHPPQAARRPGGRSDTAPGERRTHLLYLHGFRSSPRSFKAQRLQAWLAAHRPEVRWWCPQLPPSPREAMALVRHGTAGWPRGRSAVLGSSLGGFYATAVAEATGWPAVLLNPAVDPARDLARPRRRADGLPRARGALLLPRRIRRRTARPGGGGDHAARTLLRHHRQGRRGARLARDDARAIPARTIRLLEGGDHALSDFDDHLPHPEVPEAVRLRRFRSPRRSATRLPRAPGAERRQSRRCTPSSTMPANSTPAA